MSTTAVTTTSPAVITHTHIRLRGPQDSDISVRHARTTDARLTFNWGGVHMTVLNTQAAQGLLEALAAARTALIHLPENLGPHSGADDEPFARPSVAVEWTRRPGYAVTPRSAAAANANTRVMHWVEVYLGPITIQILDRAAYRTALDILRQAHQTAIAVFLDGSQHAADPTDDDYRIADTSTGLISRPR